MILETERLYLREMEQSDFDSLCKILKDEETMYAYEGAFDDSEVQEWLEIGYLFQRSYWHKGYAVEAAKACKKYAFEVLNADTVCSIIRDSNVPSQNVAIRNGMAVTDKWTKHYRGVDMPHYCYMVQRQRKM